MLASLASFFRSCRQERADARKNDDISLKTTQHVPRKQEQLQSRSTKEAEEDCAEAFQWYKMTLCVKTGVAEHLYDTEDLTKPSVWAQLDDKMIGTIVKACRDSSPHVPVLAINKMRVLVLVLYRISVQAL